MRSALCIGHKAPFGFISAYANWFGNAWMEFPTSIKESPNPYTAGNEQVVTFAASTSRFDRVMQHPTSSSTSHIMPSLLAISDYSYLCSSELEVCCRCKRDLSLLHGALSSLKVMKSTAELVHKKSEVTKAAVEKLSIRLDPPSPACIVVMWHESTVSIIFLDSLLLTSLRLMFWSTEKQYQCLLQRSPTLMVYFFKSKLLFICESLSESRSIILVSVQFLALQEWPIYLQYSFLVPVECNELFHRTNAG